MNIIPNKIIIIDTESTCWKTKEEQGDQVSEIIQIALIEVDTTNGVNIIDNRVSNYFVKPSYSSLSAFCTELTGIKEKQVRNAQSWNDVSRAIIKKHGKNKPIMAWGKDNEIIRKNDILYSCQNSMLSGEYINIGLLWTMMSGSKKNISMKNAMDSIGMEFEGEQHSALTDAMNLVNLFKVFSSWSHDRMQLSVSLQNQKNQEKSNQNTLTNLQV